MDKIKENFKDGHLWRKTAMLLSDVWANEWEKQWCEKWISNRVIAVKVGKCYEPIWGKSEGKMRKNREDLEEQLMLKRRNKWMIDNSW